MNSEKVKKLKFTEFPPASTEEWEKVIRQDLKGKNYKEELLWHTLEGIEVLPFYRRENLQDLTHIAEPIRESAQWDIIEKIDIPEIKEANKQATKASENGATGFLFHVPASSLQSKADLSKLLDGLKLENLSLHFGSHINPAKISCWIKELFNEINIKLESLTLTFAFDPFAGAIKSGKLPKKNELKKLYKNPTSSFKTFAVDADFYGNCGGGIVQQLAFALAEGNEYLAMADELEKDVSEVANRMHFSFSTASAFFLEIAKYRAFRIVWEQVLNAYDNFLSKNAPAFIHAKTARWNKSISDAHNNIIRATTEAMSAALGGCDAITIERFDADFAEHSEFSSRISRNIQLILKGEAYLDKVADAGAGSYYIEVLTENLARESWKLFQEIEQHGGFYEAAKTGFIQKKLNASQQNKIEAYRKKDLVLVGVNKYPADKTEEAERKDKIGHTTHLSFQDFHEVESISEIKIEDEIKEGEEA